jgi:protease-4
MRVAKAIWGLLVGIKDALVLLFMLLFFIGLYALLSARPAPTVSDGVLLLNLRSGVVEQPPEQDAFALAGGSATPAPLALRDVRAALRKARTTTGSRRSRSTSTASRRADGGRRSWRIARRDTRSGKPCSPTPPVMATRLPARGPRQRSVGQSDGRGQLSGPGGNNLYFAGLLEKLGVTANVYKVGKFKSAVEPFTRSDMSPEAREKCAGPAGSV